MNKAWKDLIKEGTTFCDRQGKSKYHIDCGVMIERDNDTGRITIMSVMGYEDKFKEVSWSELMTFENVGWFQGCFLVCLHEYQDRLRYARTKSGTTPEQIERLEKKVEYYKNKIK